MSTEEEIDTVPPEADTDRPEGFEVAEAFDRIEGIVREHNETMGVALNELRTTVLEQYHRTQRRLDHNDRRLDRLEKHAGLEPLEES